jgi:hypothetical protein
MYFIQIEGKANPSDLFTKILGWAEFWPLIQPLLFWKGETIIPDKPLPVIIKEIKDQIIKEIKMIPLPHEGECQAVLILL